MISTGAPGDTRVTDDPDGSLATLSRVLLIRYGYITALAAGVLVIRGLSVATAIAVLVLGWGANATAHVRSRRTGRIPGWVHIVDMVACLAFPLVVPRMAPAAMLVMLAAVALAAMASGRWWAMACSVSGTLGLAAIHLFVGVDDGLLLLIPTACASVMVSLSVGLLAASERRLRTRLTRLVEELGAIVWTWDLDRGRFTFVNHRAEELLGWPVAMWREPGFWGARVHPDDEEEVRRLDREGLASGQDYDLTYRFATADGRWSRLQVRIAISFDGSGRPRALQGTTLDVTERHQAEERVHRYADIVDNINLAFVVLAVDQDRLDRSLTLIAANPAAHRLIGRDLASSVGQTVEEVFPAVVGTPFREALDEVIRDGEVRDLGVLPIETGGDTSATVSLQAIPLAGQAVGVALHDVTELLAASEALHHQAYHDGLTGLPNRSFLERDLERRLAGGSRTPSVALLVMDVDHFREINEALGHPVGDRLLAAIGRRLHSVLGGLVARLGDDEFAVVLTGADGARAAATAERIRAALAQPFTIDGVRLQANVSIGISLSPDHATDTATLIQRADVAMYQAKQTVSGHFVYDARRDRSSIERVTLMGDLQDAVSLGQLELDFQPFRQLRTGRTARAEALVRWRHPTRGRIPPDEFIELAEISGAIHALTHWVIDESLAAVATWQAAGHALGVAVNLSVRNLYEPDLVDYVADRLAAHGVTAERLTLEVTESELMDDPVLAAEVFTAMGELGVGMSIDDFGTGYSSLTFLRDLPVRELKVDRSFVTGIVSRGDEFTIVRSMIELGHNLGLEVVAEGVEDEASLTVLENLGCDLVQGYHLSRPLSHERLMEFLGVVPVTLAPAPPPPASPNRVSSSLLLRAPPLRSRPTPGS